MKDTVKVFNRLFAITLSLVMAAAMLGVVSSQAFADDYSEAEALPASLDDEQVFQLDILVPYYGCDFFLPVNSQQEPRWSLYNWSIDWGDGNEQLEVGINSPNGYIPHNYSTPGAYSIIIRPNGSTEAWLAAFGFGRPYVIMLGIGSTDNIFTSALMVTGVPTPLRPQMTRTQAQIDGTATPPNNEWAYTFMSCANMTLAPSFVGWEGIKVVGNSFARSMYTDCTSLAALPAGFNLPQDFEVSGGNFADYMFSGAGSLSFQINDEFCFPQRLTSQNYGNFNKTFDLSDNAPVQNRTAASIIGDCPTPTSPASTFNSRFNDLPFIPVNWGGGGLPRVGAPGSGDIDGDGFVTMSEVIICAQASIGVVDLSPAQLDAIDIDRDGIITMADVVLVLKLTVL